MKLLFSSILILLCGSQFTLSQNSGSSSNSDSGSGSVIPPICIDYQCDQPLNAPCVFNLNKVEACEQGFFCMPNLSGGSSDSSSASASSSASGSSNDTSSESGSLSSSASGSSNETSSGSGSGSLSSSTSGSSNETSSSSGSTVFDIYGSTCVPKVDLGGNCTTVIGTLLSNCFDDLVCQNGTCQNIVTGTVGFNQTCDQSSDCASGNCQNQTCQSPTICIDGVYESTSCPFGQFLQCNNSLPLGETSSCVDWLREDDECESSFQCSYDQICSVDASNDESSSASASGSESGSGSNSSSSSSQSGGSSNSTSSSSQSGSSSNSTSSSSQSDSSSNSTSSSSQSGSESESGSASASISSSASVSSSASTSSGSQVRKPGAKYCRKQFTKNEGEKCSVYQPTILSNDKSVLIDNSNQLNRMDCDLSQGLVCNDGICVKLVSGGDCSKDATVCDSDYEKCICENTASSSASGSLSSSGSNSNSNPSSSDLSSSGSNSNSSSSDLSSSGSNSNSNSSSSDLSSSGSNSNSNSSSSALLSSGSNSNSNSSSSDLSSSGSNSNSSSSASGSESQSDSASSTSGIEIPTAKCVPIANYNSQCQESLTKLTQCALDNECSLGVPLTNSSCMIENCIQYFCDSPCFSTPLTCTKSDICRFYYGGSSSASSSASSSSNSTTSTSSSSGPSESDGSSSSYLAPSFALIALSISLLISNLI